MQHYIEIYEGEFEDEITAPWRPREGARVLVVDDDPAMRALLAETLEREGYEVHCAASGVALLEALSTSAVNANDPPVDLVVADVRMPGMNGVEALRRAVQRTVAVPAILMTAFPDAEVARDAEELGVPLLCKPFALEELSRVAVRILLNGGATQ